MFLTVDPAAAADCSQSSSSSVSVDPFSIVLSAPVLTPSCLLNSSSSLSSSPHSPFDLGGFNVKGNRGLLQLGTPGQEWEDERHPLLPLEL